MPYYRQSRRFRRLCGVDVGRQTLNTWIHATARHLSPLGAAIRDEVRQAIELVQPVLLSIQQIYFIEKQMRESKVPPACRELVRRTRSRAIACHIHELIISARTVTLPRGKFGEALTYDTSSSAARIESTLPSRLSLSRTLNYYEYRNHYPHYPDSRPLWRASHLESPQKLGLRTKRWIGSYRCHSAHPPVAGKNLNCLA